MRFKHLLPDVENSFAEILTLSTELDNQAEEHGRRACRNICESVLIKLPREVRDIIYGHLMDPKCRTSIRRPWDRHPVTHPNACVWKPSPRLPSWIQEAYMGKIVMLEIVERWYATRAFVLDQHRLPLLENLLSYDHYETKLEPRSTIRHIEFSIWNAKSSALISLAEDVKLLDTIHNKHIKIAFVRSYSMLKNAVTATTLLEFLKLVRPAVQQLRSTGHRGVYVGTVTPTLDLTYIFDTPEIDFEAELVRFRKTVCNLGADAQ